MITEKQVEKSKKEIRREEFGTGSSLYQKVSLVRAGDTRRSSRDKIPMHLRTYFHFILKY